MSIMSINKTKYHESRNRNLLAFSFHKAIFPLFPSSLTFCNPTPISLFQTLLILLFRHQQDLRDPFQPLIGPDQGPRQRRIPDDLLDFGQEGLISQVVSDLGVTQKLLEHLVQVLVLVLRDLELLDGLDALLEDLVGRVDGLGLCYELVLLVGQQFFLLDDRSAVQDV